MAVIPNKLCEINCFEIKGVVIKLGETKLNNSIINLKLSCV